MALQSQAADRCGLQQDRRRSACFYHQTCPRQPSVQVRAPRQSSPVSPGSYASAFEGDRERERERDPFAPPPYPHLIGGAIITLQACIFGARGLHEHLNTLMLV
ncbi:hypothetical protein LY76DRAFT_586871 [Colletotrichum caudatum]|nr:hypothetical protein LY76DRAFT_586871 [Colletotrichum caudatum]